MGSFEFAVLASLRAAQLARGCTPRVTEDHKSVITAQLEVADGKVAPVAMIPQPVSAD
jgi:DNA-directed RNA polymerase subunit K/omega